ncbi:MAG: hypothetical protein HOF27_08270, partial [Rhodospirillaceae bacterium]|nr:hypothetical protein [Rhodospirillaceae bacterium]
MAAIACGAATVSARADAARIKVFFILIISKLPYEFLLPALQPMRRNTSADSNARDQLANRQFDAGIKSVLDKSGNHRGPMMSIPALSKPPFRADHVGSLLRPEELLDARYAEGPEKPTVDDLRALEDRHIPNVISLQEKVGLQSVTDGEFRRASFRSPVVSRVDGFTTVPQDPIWAARDETGHSHPLGDAPLAIAKLARNRGIATHEFEFLRPRTDRTPKIALPAPSYHFFYRHPEKAAYSDPEDYLDDL